MANPADRLPPDFDDLYPRDYDPDFTVDISTKMRVPDRLGLVDNKMEGMMQKDYSAHSNNVRRSMNVPDRIMISGQDEHVGMREGYRKDPTLPDEGNTYLGLSTPPRSLKLDENIYAANEDFEQRFAAQASQNGYVPASVPASVSHVTFEGASDHELQVTPKKELRPDLEALTTPGGGLLLQDSDDDDMIVLRRQVMKLTRHVVNLQQENEKRSQRELILYPIVLGYIIMQVAKWFIRSN